MERPIPGDGFECNGHSMEWPYPVPAPRPSQASCASRPQKQEVLDGLGEHKENKEIREVKEFKVIKV